MQNLLQQCLDLHEETDEKLKDACKKTAVLEGEVAAKTAEVARERQRAEALQQEKGCLLRTMESEEDDDEGKQEYEGEEKQQPRDL